MNGEEERQFPPPGAEETPEGAGEDESFAQLFAESTGQARRLEPGQKVRTTVVGISGDMLFVDLGGKSEGVIALTEFQDEDSAVPNIGDQLDAYFVSVENGVRKMTTLVKGYSTVTLAGIRDAYEASLPVSGTVSRAVKGGFEVKIGKVRSFCPFSQMDVRGGQAPEARVGETLPFKVIEYGEDGGNIVLSRRALLEEERKRKADEVKATLAEGATVTGTVKSIQKFGVFVDLGGIDGLIPMSELGWGMVGAAEDVVSIGQEVTVRVITLDWERNRITLSLKALQEDPWQRVVEKYPVDSVAKGNIVRLTPFGAFVNLEPGVDGLVHVSRLGAGRRVKHPQDVVAVGQWVAARVVGVDSANKRISLSMEPETQKVAVELPAVGDIIDGTVERVMPYGIFVKLTENLTGLLPNSEVGTPRGTNHARMFPVGSVMRVVVVEVDSDRGRMTLSKTKLAEREEQEDLGRYRDSVERETAASGSLGSLGEILKAKLESLR